jgi:RNA polymerase sigma factor (sigma-70 family)
MKILYSDKKIVSDLRSGDKLKVNNTLHYLYKSYYRMAVNVIKTNSGNEYEAADVFQDALISFYESVQREKFRGDSSIKTYLYSTVRNLWLTRLKKSNRMVDIENQYNNVVTAITDKDNFDDEQPETLLKRIIDKTGEQCKELLRLYYYENRSMKEITALMNFSNENSTKTQKYKCMKKLIGYLDTHPELKKSLLERN